MRNNTAKKTVYENDLADKIKIEISRTYSFSFNQCVRNLYDFLKQYAFFQSKSSY